MAVVALSPEIIQVLNPRLRRAEITEAASGRSGSVVANCATSLKVDTFSSETGRGRNARSAMLFPAAFHVEALLDWEGSIGVPSEVIKASLPIAASYRVSRAGVWIVNVPLRPQPGSSSIDELVMVAQVCFVQKAVIALAIG